MPSNFSPSVFGGGVHLRRPIAGYHSGMRLGGRKRRTRHRGRGFFGDVWNGIKSAGSHVLPVLGNIAKDIGVKLISSRLGLGRRRRRTHRTGMRRRHRTHRTARTGMRRRRRRTRTGMRRRRTHHKRRGRGILGTLGSLLGSFGLGRRRRTHRRTRHGGSASVYGGRRIRRRTVHRRRY